MIPRLATAAWAAALLIVPHTASAQVIGIGPRMSFVQSDVVDGAPRDRYTGGTLRMRLSPRTAIEAAADWKSTTSQDGTVRIRDFPIQGSLLVYPVRAALSPYLVGGVGWYSQTTQAMAAGEVLAAQTVRRFGYHGGFGGEIRMGRRATLFADYRYRFIRFGEDDDAAPGENGAGAFGIPGVGSLLDTFRMSHEGTMWTGGVTINF
ncbi:MAG: porin family protein [Acidobacteriota bacterium]|nr:porin family protein [Acidobacteriota bacterium]